jgi:hypothetical protein
MVANEPSSLQATGTEGLAAYRVYQQNNHVGQHPGQESAAHAQQLGRDLVLDDAIGCNEDKPSSRKVTSPNPLRVTGLCESMRNNAKRRARDSNPQRLAPHLISSQAANHSRTLRATKRYFNRNSTVAKLSENIFLTCLHISAYEYYFR